MCVCPRFWMHMWVCECVWRAKVDLRNLPWSHSTLLLEKVSQVNPEPTSSMSWSSYAASSGEILSSPSEFCTYSQASMPTGIYMLGGDVPNPSPYGKHFIH